MKIYSNKTTPEFTPCTLSLTFESAKELAAFTALVGRVGAVSHGINFNDIYHTLLSFTDNEVSGVPLFNDYWMITPLGETILEKTFDNIPF